MLNVYEAWEHFEDIDLWTHCIRNIHTVTLTWHFCAYVDIVVRDILRDREYMYSDGWSWAISYYILSYPVLTRNGFPHKRNTISG